MAERLTVFDRAELATDIGPHPRHITVLLLLGGAAPDVDEVRRRIAHAVAAQPRLACLVRRRGPWRAPVWESQAVDVARHVCVAAAPGDPVVFAVDDLVRPLPPGRPPWRLTVLDLADDSRSALVWTSHHALGNGPSLLDLLLRSLADDPVQSPHAPGRGPDRASGAQPLPDGRDARRGPTRWAGRSPLVRPITGGVVAVPVSVDAADVRAGARTCGATVNDALLWAWARAYRRADLACGGPGGRIVLSVPVSVRGTRFGNVIGSLRVAVPDADGSPADALAALAARTRRAKRRIRPWTWPFAPFGARMARRVGLLPVVLDRQRLLSTVVTHAPGPREPVRLVGVPLVGTVPLVPPVGNVTTCAVAVSIGGRLDVAVVCAPQSADLADALAADLHDGLRQVAALGGRLP